MIKINATAAPLRTERELHIKYFKLLQVCALLCFLILFTAGCTDFICNEPDCNPKSANKIITSEDFIFKTYKKYSAKENIDLHVGFSSTEVEDIIIGYILIENHNNFDYLFQFSDLGVKEAENKLEVISSTSYLARYQSMQSDLYSAVSQAAYTLGAMGLSNQKGNMDEHQLLAEQNSLSSFNSQLSGLAKGINTHSIKTSRLIPAKSSDYIYVFYRDEAQYPIYVEYADLKFEFKLK